MSNQKYHNIFISYCIKNNKKDIIKLMKKRPIDFRYIVKAFRICILLENNDIIKLLYNKMGGCNKLGKEFISNLIFIAYDDNKTNILIWLIKKYKKYIGKI
jgi:hypothetical protein